MKLTINKLMVGTAAILGSILWIFSGIILTQAPSGNPPYSFRSPAIDIRPYLAIGLLLISSAIGGYMFSYAKNKNRSLYIGSLITIASGICYVVGRIYRNLFLQKTGWEPLMPLGFLAFIVGFLYMGIALFKIKAVPKTISVLLIATGITLLFFNDQYLPWMAITFGLCSLTVSILLVQGSQKLEVII